MYTIKLTYGGLQVLANALRKEPYYQVAELIADIDRQISESAAGEKEDQPSAEDSDETSAKST